MQVHSEVLIVGGGVAGLALALELGRAGVDVALVDKRLPPRDKVCGEGIMPFGVAALRRLGLLPERLPGVALHGLAFRSRRHGAALAFDGPEAGLGLRRTALIGALQRTVDALPSVRQYHDRVRRPLWAAAGDAPGVVGAEGAHHDYRASVIAAADGVHGSFSATLSGARQPRGAVWALRRHYRLASEVAAGWAADWVEVGLCAPYDLYLTPTGPDEVLVTAMTDRAGYAAIAADYDGFLRGGPYAALLAGAEGTSPILGWHHPLFRPAHYAPGGVLLVGDAGGGADPCLGTGVSFALRSAALAADAVRRVRAAPGERAAAAQDFHRARRALFQNVDRFDNIFRLLVHSRRGSALLGWALQTWPATAAATLQALGAGQPVQPGAVLARGLAETLRPRWGRRGARQHHEDSTPPGGLPQAPPARQRAGPRHGTAARATGAQKERG